MTIHHLYISPSRLHPNLSSLVHHFQYPNFFCLAPSTPFQRILHLHQRFPFLVVVLVRRTVDPIAAPRPPLAAAIRVDTRDFIKGSRNHVISRIVQGTKGERRCYTRGPISLRIREEESRRKSIETTLRDGFFQLYIPNIRRTNGAMIN